MIDKYSFMEVLKEQGFSPVDEDGCVMIITPNKDDSSRLYSIAESCGYDGKGSYGWRKTKDSKAESKQIEKASTVLETTEPVYSEEEKRVAMQRARDLDKFDMNFLETIQNEEWYDDTKRVLKEYAKFLDDPDEYMTTPKHP